MYSEFTNYFPLIIIIKLQISMKIVLFSNSNKQHF